MRSHYFAGLLARQLHTLTDQALDQAIGELELTPSQSRILGYLVRHRDQLPCQKDVEDCFSLSHPTVSGVLSRLEDKGFVYFETDKADGRKKRIRVTDKAVEIDARVHQAIDQMENRIIEDFSPQEAALFAELLSRGIRNLGGEPCRVSERTQKEETK